MTSEPDTSDHLRDEVGPRLAGWARQELRCVLTETDGLRLSLDRESVGTASIAVSLGLITSEVRREDGPPMHAATPVTTAADFGRLLDGIAGLLAPPPELRETKRQKRDRKRAAKDYWATRSQG